MRLEGKTAIVTGGANGIGYAIARRYIQEDARVVIADVDNKAGHEAEARLKEMGEALFVHADVSDRLDVRNMLAQTQDAFGPVDILVNNAGIVHAEDFLDIKEDDFDRVLATNLKGTFLCSQIIASHMVQGLEEGRIPGAIINISSINAFLAIPNQVPYCVSKGGIDQLTKVMALSLAKHGIRVNAIGPGSIMTDMLSAVNDDPEARNRLLSRTPMGRIGDPAEIASIAVFLATNEASYVTGQTIYADGGRLALNYTVPVDED